MTKRETMLHWPRHGQPVQFTDAQPGVEATFNHPEHGRRVGKVIARTDTTVTINPGWLSGPFPFVPYPLPAETYAAADWDALVPRYQA